MRPISTEDTPADSVRYLTGKAFVFLFGGGVVDGLLHRMHFPHFGATTVIHI